MGALHAGHLSLVEAAGRACDRVIVTIFVNPAQFGPNEDFARYPRTLVADIEKLSSVAADLVFAPSVEEVYPPGFSTKVVLEGPARANLEDRFRPTHFPGVATVVTKLLNQAQADIAVFGEKDYQQLLVIKQLARDLDIATEILGAPTLREADGLAMSSRNVYLSSEERERAKALHRALKEAARRILDGDDIDVAMAAARAALADVGFEIDYVEARHAETLAPVASLGEGPIRLLAAAKLGATRLIDNIAVES
jgi:pantoate--beta-alanine ligase